MSRNLSTNSCHRLQRVDISYKGKIIKPLLAGPSISLAVLLPCMEPVAKGINWNSHVWAILDTARTLIYFFSIEEVAFVIDN